MGEGHFRYREQHHTQVQKHEKLMCMLESSLAEVIVGHM